MPKLKEPGSLRKVCLLNMAYNMEKFWLADHAQAFLDQGDFLHVLGPFDCLTPSLIHELITLLFECRLMKRYFLHVLIDGRLRSLDLSVCKLVSNKDSIINLVATRCQKLTNLNLALCNQVSARTLADLVQALPLLQLLNLRQTKCSDQVLSVIGQHCRSLQDLTLFGCHVSDMGVMSLCVSFDPKQRKCEQLRRLDVGCTDVTSKGAEIAIRNLPNLQYLLHPDVCEALMKVHVSDSSSEGDGSQEKQHGLRSLYMSDMNGNLPPLEESIRLSCIYCPYVTEVHFTRGVTNSSILHLCSLRHLTVLSVANTNEEQLTFEDGMLPLLRARGANLVDLSMFEVNSIDIGLIGLCCPKLQKFSCLVAGFDEALFPIYTHPELHAGAADPQPFTKLQCIRILLHTSENNFPVQYIRLLMRHALSLREVHFAFVQSLDDALFEEVLCSDKLDQLSKLVLESCHHVSGKVISFLLSQPNQLMTVVLKDCQAISRRDSDSYQRLLRKSNFDLTIEWS